jgi:hypothetical protein
VSVLLARVDERRGGSASIASKPVLVVGAACSGTTWVAGTLAQVSDLAHVHEPDNPLLEPFAFHARTGLGAYPAIAAGARAPDAYTRLWDVAFGRRRRRAPAGPARRLWRRVSVDEKLRDLDPLPPGTGDDDLAAAHTEKLSRRARTALRLAQPMPRGRASTRRVVTSVDLPLALEWVRDRYEPEIVFVRRHPLDVVASRIRHSAPFHLGDATLDGPSVDERFARWRIPRRPLPGHAFARLVWLVGFEMSAYQEFADAHPEVLVVDYKRLCTHTDFELRRLLTNLELVWRSGDERVQPPDLREVGDEAGANARSLAPTVPPYLSPEQVSVARHLLTLFPIARHYHDLTPPYAATGR